MLSAACARTPAGWWISAHTDARDSATAVTQFLHRYVIRALDHGTVEVAECGGQVIAAALWTVHPTTAAPSPGPGAAPMVQQFHQHLEVLAGRRRPDQPHHQLRYLGVDPDHQRRGVAGQLLRRHLTAMDATGTPSFALAGDLSEGWLARHGYTAIGPRMLAPGALPVSPMWREPLPSPAPPPPDLAAASRHIR